MSERKRTTREAWSHAMRQTRLLIASTFVGWAGGLLLKEKEYVLALDAYELAIQIGTQP